MTGERRSRAGSCGQGDVEAISKNGSPTVILGANWFAKLYSARCAMDSRFRGNDSD